MNYNQTLEFLFQSLPAFETQGADGYKNSLPARRQAIF